MTPIALVTGASLGIGRSTALALGRAGYAVGITARTESKLRTVESELRGLGIPVAAAAADVGDPAQVERMHAAIRDRLGPIDVLVNNAGVAFPKPFLELSLEEWDRTFATNVRGLFLVTRAVLPAMFERKAGDIVNIASLAGKNGTPQLVAYSASKHAVMGFSKSLMLEVRKQGVRVITICPGSVDTPLMRGQSVMNPNYEKILQPDDVAATVVDAIRLPRNAMVSEIDIRPSDP